MRTAANESEELVKLKSYISQLPHGTVAMFQEVANETGVPMDKGGKDKLRIAMKRCSREYAPIRGIGVKLADPDSTMPILSLRLQRIDGQVRRSERAQKILQRDFYLSLKPEEQQGILFVGAIFGAIRSAADNGLQAYGKGAIKRLANVDPVVETKTA